MSLALAAAGSCQALLGLGDYETAAGAGGAGGRGGDGGGGGSGGEDGGLVPCVEAADCAAGEGSCHCGACAYHDGSCVGSQLRYARQDGAEGPCVPVATQVDAYYQHGCVRRSDGTVWCWGRNCEGQLGNQPGSTDCSGNVVLSADPVQVTIAPGQPLTGVSRVVTGIYHSCALRDGGSVWCWGGNASGQLGSGPADEVLGLVPRQVLTADDSPLIDVEVLAAGGEHTCARDADGAVWCWGFNNYGQIGTPDWQGEGGGPVDTRPRALKVSAGNLLFRHLGAGGEHTCASSTEPGEPIYCWGRNNLGQLGWSTSMDSAPQPTPVVVLDASTGLALPGASAVGAGNRFSCAGTYANPTHLQLGLWCWGQNARHALGDDSNPGAEDGLTRWTAVPVALELSSAVKRVDGGDRFACAVLQNGQLWCWGSADGGELGTETASLWLGPTLVLDDGRDVAAGFDHACAVTSDNRVLCWGDNDSGQLGDGTQIDRHAPTEVGAMCP